ncbi:hypothetical protein HMF7854_09935 [Sphingomonas ginkgonis]|uniref:Uncharacterized protein n=1 Tax=Sphingomonas ginkgonis TaxID=2315330 RepID=A0A429VAY9_9SPHN|nr:hypothetical protein [Sphingomonas ginkgonis]RST31121.1 hypothetical protein HMF7854_09935 [Sphingomonas ginkgonis]
MMLLSDVRMPALLGVVDVFGVVASNTAVLILCAFTAAALWRPALIGEWKDRLFWVWWALAVRPVDLGLHPSLFRQPRRDAPARPGRYAVDGADVRLSAVDLPSLS